MASPRFTTLIIVRVILLMGSIILLAWLWYRYDLFFTYFLLLMLIALQVYELINFAGRVNRELKKFLDALRFEDYAVSFSNRDLGGSFRELDQSFSQVVEMVRLSKAEKQSQTELLGMALENIRLGLLIVDQHGNIVLMNAAAREMLDIPHFHSWAMLQKKKKSFTDHVADFTFEGRKLIELQGSNGMREFYLDLNHINLLGQSYHLIAFSDLKNEIEQKEIDAWHKLIRILAHEVMNSVTPVTSLSETIRNLLTDKAGNPLPPEKLDKERIDDIILALETIIRRSHGMLNFVEDYRKLTKLPAPNFEAFTIKAVFSDVCQLMQAEAKTKEIELKTDLQNSKLSIRADRKMVEQILINLIGNALHMIEPGGGGKILLSAHVDESRVVLTVSDNGPGIPENILPSIFIPFFSTRKNGTGIGLTLSKNIMKLHKGNISVRSKPGEGTTFELSFNI